MFGSLTWRRVTRPLWTAWRWRRLRWVAFCWAAWWILCKGFGGREGNAGADFAWLSFLMKSIGSADFGKEESRQSQHFVRKFTLRIFPDSTELDVCGANFHQITNAQIQTSQNKSALFKFYRPKTVQWVHYRLAGNLDIVCVSSTLHHDAYPQLYPQRSGIPCDLLSCKCWFWFQSATIWYWMGRNGKCVLRFESAMLHFTGKIRTWFRLETGSDFFISSRRLKICRGNLNHCYNWVEDAIMPALFLTIKRAWLFGYRATSHVRNQLPIG